LTSTRTLTRDHTLASDLRLVVHQVRYEQKAFWINKTGAMFTIGFSVIFLIMLGATNGTQTISYLGNITNDQYYVPGFIAYGIMAACFSMLTSNLVTRRETGLLKRLRLTPLPAWALLSSIFLSTAIVAIVQAGVLLVIGRLGYGVAFPSEWWAFLLVLAVGIASFTAMGVALSSVIPNQETAGPVTSVAFFVLLFLSGLWFPLPPHSGLEKFSNFFPVRHFLIAVRAPFEQQPGMTAWPWRDLLIVAAWGAVAAFIALRRFRWSPHRS
jgi:ABC-2 type transport system permease protein